MPTADISKHHSILAAIIDNSDDAIISKNLDGMVTSWNKAAEGIFGYSADEMVGQHISRIIPPDRLDEENMIISNLRAGKRIAHFETVRRRKDGMHIHISLTVSPVKDEHGMVTGASKIARDISIQKQMQLRLQEYNEQLELISAIGKTIVSELDAQVILQKVTDATTKISGAAFGAFFYNKIDSKGEAYMLYSLSGARREDFEKFGMPRNTAVFEKTFSGSGIFRSDDITKDPSYGKNSPHRGMPEGHLPVVSYLAVPVISPSGVVAGGLFFGHPQAAKFREEHESLVSAIATQAAIALDNAKLYEEIKLLNAQKDEFIGFASHELKTPLTTARGFLELAGVMPEQTQGFIPKIDKQLQRLSAIIDDLLDVSKIQAGRLELHLKPTNLLELIHNSAEATGVSSGTHNIELDLPAHEIVVTVDRVKMEQVLVNLLSNAIKYSPGSNQVKVSATLLGDTIQVSVADKGIGIPKAYSEKIFNRYYRMSHTERIAKGQGLGLYIAQGIIEAHSGKIWVESEEGKGSVFFFTFPVEGAKKSNKQI